MQFEIHGNPDYGEVQVGLSPGEKLVTESGAMSRMSVGLELKSRVLGGMLPALGRKFLGGESFFLGEYGGDRGGELWLSPGVPGTVVHRKLNDDAVYLTAGSFLACTPGVHLKTKFGGVRAFFSGEGAFFIECSGQGELFYNAYGSVLEREIDGALTVDTGHLVAWEPSLSYKIGGMGGIKQTLFSGEGLVMRFEGRGKLWLQTRHLSSTARWLTPFTIG
ncbi:MAG: TIGR00266 family protein [bacterium]|nr:TIGR00266 family protein [bacterium]